MNIVTILRTRHSDEPNRADGCQLLLVVVTPSDEDEYGGQHEGEDEEDVVGPDADVIGAESDDSCHPLAPGGAVEVDDLGGVTCAETDEFARFVVECS